MYLKADGIIFTYKGVGVFIKRSAERNDVVKTKSEHRLPQLLTGSEENRTYLIPSTSFDSSTELDSPSSWSYALLRLRRHLRLLRAKQSRSMRNSFTGATCQSDYKCQGFEGQIFQCAHLEQKNSRSPISLTLLLDRFVCLGISTFYTSN